MADAAPKAGGPIHVLIVDDEPLIRWSLAEVLSGFGCETAEASDAESAQEMLVDGPERFDIILLDYHLPDANDLGLLSATRRLSPGSQVIMMTAFITPEDRTRALELGARDVLSKPVELDALARLVVSTYRASHASPPSARLD